MRKAEIERKTDETRIKLALNIDGLGISNINTPINFLNHMLAAFVKHGSFDLDVDAEGDTEIDQHHTVEDLGLVLGTTFKEALGDMRGINRAGFFAFPMDETLGIVAVDFGGRPYLVFKAEFTGQTVGDLESDCIKEFFSGFSMGAKCNISVNLAFSGNDHHNAESLFKSFGKALWMACSKNSGLKEFIPSTKGIID